MKSINLPTTIIFTLAIQCLGAQTWTTAELSKARWEIATTANQHKLVCGGGFTASNIASDAVDIYDALSGTWTTAKLSQPRAVMSAVAAGDKVVFAGGTKDNSVFSKAVDIYDIKTGQWAVDSLAQPTSGILGVGVGKKAYFFGGFSTVLLNSLQIYDTETGQWAQETMPFATSGAGTICAFGKKIMIKRPLEFGVYDTETGTWETGTFPSATPARQSAVVTPTEIWMIGGFYNGTSNSSAEIFIYNIASKQWSDFEMFSARCGLMACYLNEKIIIAGGQNEFSAVPGTVNDIVEIFDTKTGNWDLGLTAISQPRGWMSYQRNAPVIGNQAFFPGGDASGNGTAATRVDIYSDTALTNILLPKLPENSVQIFPQPCQDFLNVKIGLPKNENTRLEICDPSGRTVFQDETSNSSFLEKKIDVSGLPAGCYLLKVFTENAGRAERFLKIN